MVIHSFINLLIKDNKIYVHLDDKQGFLKMGYYHWLLRNDKIKFTPFYPVKDDKTIIYEVLNHKKISYFIESEICSYHFVCVKDSRHKANIDLISKNPYGLDDLRKSQITGTRLDEKMIDEKRILDIYNSFAWENSKFEKP